MQMQKIYLPYHVIVIGTELKKPPHYLVAQKARSIVRNRCCRNDPVLSVITLSVLLAMLILIHLLNGLSSVSLLFCSCW